MENVTNIKCYVIPNLAAEVQVHFELKGFSLWLKLQFTIWTFCEDPTFWYIKEETSFLLDYTKVPHCVIKGILSSLKLMCRLSSRTLPKKKVIENFANTVKLFYCFSFCWCCPETNFVLIQSPFNINLCPIIIKNHWSWMNFAEKCKSQGQANFCSLFIMSQRVQKDLNFLFLRSLLEMWKDVWNPGIDLCQILLRSTVNPSHIKYLFS